MFLLISFTYRTSLILKDHIKFQIRLVGLVGSNRKFQFNEQKFNLMNIFEKLLRIDDIRKFNTKPGQAKIHLQN